MQVTVPNIAALASKQDIVDSFQTHLQAQGLTIAQVDAARPWGAFLRIVNDDADKFIRAYFGDISIPERAKFGERSPKILLVAPHQRLSWQYHERRSELWRVVTGPVGVFVSETDAQPENVLTLNAGEMIELVQGKRQRLVGLDSWGAVAEIWIHMDNAHASDEDDIYRLQDDYARS
jgi:mannose-6-phosphate isomerase